MNGNVIITYRKSQLKDIHVEQLKSGVYQPRRAASKEALLSLAQTISQVGILEPLVVRPLAKTSGQYEIIAGERRWRAAKLVGLDTVPCMVSNHTDEEAAQIALIENIAREKLNPISKAKAMLQLIEEFNYTHEQVGKVLGISREAVTHQLRLLRLDDRLKVWLGNNDLLEGHGKLLAGAPLEYQYELGYESVRQGWTTRTLEIEIKRRKSKRVSATKLAEKRLEPLGLRRIEDNLVKMLGCPVKIRIKKDDAGYVRIDFASVKEMKSLLKNLGG